MGAASLAQVLAWTPLLQPAPGAEHWWWMLVVPMAVGIAMSYKAIRTKDLRDWPRDVLRMSVQVLVAVVGIAVGLYLLVIVLLPHLPAE